MRDFNQWFDTFRNSINGYGYYTDFEKVYDKINSIKVELNILNSLVGSKDIKREFIDVVENYPNVLKCIPILLAVRGNEIYCQDEDGAYNFCFNKMNYTIDEYCDFMEKTGLFEMISNHVINNLVDYCTGIEVGLDSNARKNRGGHQMEDLVESFIKKAGHTYYKEMYLSEVEKKWGVDLSKISAEGTTTKRWDYVIETEKYIYVVETNFYTSGGSKLNETARSYKMIAEEAKDLERVKFVWITDGAGWKSAKRNLKETFDTMNTLYNITDMENGLFGTF